MTQGDRNKRGSSGRGSSNQSNQRFKRTSKHSKSNQTEPPSWPSEIQERGTDADINLDRNSHRLNERRFNLVVDSVPYLVRVVPFAFNGEIRYRVSFNESSEHVFTWDSSLGQLRAIDDDASTMPDNLEIAISGKLQSRS
jgi:hypothetical protein